MSTKTNANANINANANPNLTFSLHWALPDLGPTTQRDAFSVLILFLVFASLAIAILGPLVSGAANRPNDDVIDKLAMRPRADALRQLIEEATVHAKFATSEADEEGQDQDQRGSTGVEDGGTKSPRITRQVQ